MRDQASPNTPSLHTLDAAWRWVDRNRPDPTDDIVDRVIYRLSSLATEAATRASNEEWQRALIARGD